MQAYQLVLWKQCHTLIHTLGLPCELEVVVKDLWSLRLNLLKDRIDRGESDGETFFSSQPISEEDTESEEIGKGKWTEKALPSLIETLGICYLAMIILRLPIGMGDLHKYAVREDMPYIRAVRFIPAEMKGRLPAEYLLALDTTSPLKAGYLRKTIHNTCLLYHHHFQLDFPPLNMPLLLYKHIRGLALPIDAFQAVTKIAKILSMDFSFPKPRRHQRISHLPEMALVSLLVIVIKLYHPFNAIHYSAISSADVAILAVDWDAWIAARRAHESRMVDPEHLSRGSEINVTEEDAMEMTGTQLDDYLDWYERTWVDEERTQRKARGVPSQLLEMFPTGRQDGSQPKPYDFTSEAKVEQESTTQRLAEMMGRLQVREVVSGEERNLEERVVMRVGSSYKRYRRVEDLNGHAKAFHEAVADVVAVTPETLLISVLQIERRLIVWREEQVKAERVDQTDQTNQDDVEMQVLSESSDEHKDHHA